MLQKIDVKSALWLEAVASYREASFAYRLEDLIFVNLRLQFR